MAKDIAEGKATSYKIITIFTNLGGKTVLFLQIDDHVRDVSKNKNKIDGIFYEYCNWEIKITAIG